MRTDNGLDKEYNIIINSNVRMRDIGKYFYKANMTFKLFRNFLSNEII